MTDKIQKYLSRLDSKRKNKILERVIKIKRGEWDSLQVIPLSGKKNFFRDKIGDTRIIFQKEKNGQYEIISISNRNEKTYK